MQTLQEAACSSAFIIAALFLAVSGQAAIAGDQPATRPSDTRVASTASQEVGKRKSDELNPAAGQMAKLFADLASPDAHLRESAKVSLMSLRRADLPALQRLVRERHPLFPSQAVALKDIVTQMFLSGDNYEAKAREGFLGIRPAEVSIGPRETSPKAGVGIAQVPAGLNPPAFPGVLEAQDPDTAYGILVMERMTGFAGARSLQDGDVILGIVERPNVQFRNTTDFSLAIREIGAAKTAHLEVLRQGRVIRVEAVLDARPDAAEFVPGGPNPMQQLLDDRRDKADAYWEREFAPLLEEGLG